MSSPEDGEGVHTPNHKVLQEFNRLERSSPNFLNQFTSLLSRGEYGDPSFHKSVRKEDIAWLIEYLDKALETLHPVGPAYRKCLHELQRICSVGEALPRSYTLGVSSLVPTADPTPIGPYEIICEGSLNDSKVWAKKLKPCFSPEWESVTKHFPESIVKWKNLRHTNVVPFLGFTDEPIHIVSTRMPGVELEAYITNHPETNQLGLLTDIANGLDYLHSRDVVHGDLGGPNIIVDDSGCPRITEFGLTLVFPTSLSSQIRRCARWAEPLPSFSTDADVFSFAMVTVEAFTGQVPFFPQSDSEARSAVERGERPERPTDMGLADSVWALIEQCWDENPRNRPKMSDVSRTLRDCRNDKRVLVSVLPPTPTDIDLHELDFTTLSAENLFRLGEDFVRALPVAAHGHAKSAMEEGWVGLISETISRAGTLPTGLSSQDAAVLAETFREALLHLHLSDSFVRDLWIRLHVHTLLRGSYVFHGLELYTESPDFEPFGFADAWRGDYHGVPVCIKAIRTRNMLILEKIKRVFYHELQGCKSFLHPNILPVAQVSEALFPFCIISPWMPEGNIMQYTQNNPSANRLMLLEQVCHGLSYLHGLDIPHGCIAPNNILITRDGWACLGDFGVTGAFGTSSFPKFKLGTARYMAPERLTCLGGKPSKGSDIYSLAMTSFTVLTGIFPYYDSRSHYSLMVRIKSGERPSRPTNLGGALLLPDSVWGTIKACWSGDPNQRSEVSAICEVFSALVLLEGKVKADIRTEGKQRESKRKEEERSSERFRWLIAFFFRFLLLNPKNSETQRLVDELDQRLESRTMSDRERQKLMNELCHMCSRHCVIPNSMRIPDCSNDATEVHYWEGLRSLSKSTYAGYQMAIKDVNVRTVDLGTFRSGFCREVVAWKHLRHPNILPLLGVTFWGDQFSVVSEWMNNGNVNEFVQRDSDANRTALLADVANGLKYMHDLRMVHGGLKGVNILINNDRRACISDFSLTTITGVGAQTFPERSQISTFMSGDTLMSFVGGRTARWMSPELLVPDQFNVPQSEGDRPTRQSDCYALGMVIYEVLCGIHPFYEIEAGNSLVMSAIIDGKRPERPESAARLGFNDELWATVERCWKPNRHERPAVEEILSCLNDATAFWYMREL